MLICLFTAHNMSAYLRKQMRNIYAEFFGNIIQLTRYANLHIGMDSVHDPLRCSQIFGGILFTEEILRKLLT